MKTHWMVSALLVSSVASFTAGCGSGSKAKTDAGDAFAHSDADFATDTVEDSAWAGGTPWAGVVDPSRAVDWSHAGATITPATTQCGATIAAYTGAADAINTAITSCPSGQFVQLGAGTFHLSTGIRMGTSGVTLRGMGADQTILIPTAYDDCGGSPSGAICIWNNDGNYMGGPTNTANWIDDYAKGSTSITLDSTANLQVGMLLFLDQLNDTYQITAASCSGGIVTATLDVTNLQFSMTHSSRPLVTVQGVSPTGYNSPATGGSYPITAVTASTVSYNLGGACPASYASGGTITLDDGAFTMTNDGAFSSYHAAGNNTGRPGNQAPCGLSGSTPPYNGLQCRSATQMVTVTGCGSTTTGAACTSNTVTISPGVYHPRIRADRTPGAWWGSNLPVTGAGVEDLTIDGTNIDAGGIISFNNASQDWVKGVRTLFANSSHVLLWQSARCTARDSYFYGNKCHTGTCSQSYMTDQYGGSSDNLVENNIFQHGAAAMQNEGGMGNVYGYNYSIDNDNAAASPPGSYPLSDEVQHAPGTMYTLYESNITLSAMVDDFHGNSWSPTYFRNRLKGYEPGKNTQTSAIQIQTGARSTNIVGGVYGIAGFHNKYSWQYGVDSSTDEADCSKAIYALGFSGHCDSRIAAHNCDTNTCEIDDPQLNLPNASEPGTTLLWGNYDTVNGAVQFTAAEIPSALPIFANAVPADHTLAASFYGANTTAFWTTPWGTPPYPAIGPDVTGGDLAGLGGYANALPAQLAFANVPLDTTYSVASPVTGATCTANTVTLTIGAQAANIDTGSVVVVTGVSPAGYNCTDRTACQVSATTATTVSYPVASCPGAFVSGGSATAPAILSFNAGTSY